MLEKGVGVKKEKLTWGLMAETIATIMVVLTNDVTPAD